MEFINEKHTPVPVHVAQRAQMGYWKLASKTAD